MIPRHLRHSRSRSTNRSRAASPLPVDGARLELESFDKWEAEVQRVPVYRLAQLSITSGKESFLLAGRARQIADADVFNIEVDLAGKALTDQQMSGRCWIFAMLNILRVLAARKYGIEDFQLSQAYLFFMDHMSKANWFLENVLNKAELPLESREMQYDFKDGCVEDGGDYDLIVALIMEFGVVPQSLYPDNWVTEHTAQMDSLINTKIRDFALDLREEYGRGMEEGLGHASAVAKARLLKTDQLKAIYRIMTICVGSPPSPHSVFTWEFTDKKKHFRKIQMTPLGFAQALDYDLANTMVLSNDPRNPYNRAYAIEEGGCVVGGRTIRYVNVPIDVMKQAVVKQLKRGIPVWFGTNIMKAAGAARYGVMDTKTDEFETAFGFTIDMDKAERMRTADSVSDHAMVFVGAHVDDTGRLVRLKVENSWGPKVCDKGFLTMTEHFFDEYVYSVGLPKDAIPNDIVRIYERDQAIVLPPWDAMS